MKNGTRKEQMSMLRQMHLTSTLVVLGNFAMLALGCEPTESPTLCVFTSTTMADLEKCPQPAHVAQEGKDPTHCLTSITADGVIHLRHVLPENVSPSGPLALRVETPCSMKTYEVPYVDGIALWSNEAPIGATCSISITAVLDNSELRCTLQANTETGCTNICPDAPTP